MENVNGLRDNLSMASFPSSLPTWSSRFNFASADDRSRKEKELTKSVSDEEQGQNILERLNPSSTSCTNYEKYVRYYEDPFSLFREDNPDDIEYLKEHYDSYIELLQDFMIHENDAWGMKRLSAYAGATTVLVSGPYKGLPRSFPGKVFYLDKIKKMEGISKS